MILIKVTSEGEAQTMADESPLLIALREFVHGRSRSDLLRNLHSWNRNEASTEMLWIPVDSNKVTAGHHY